MIYRKQIINGIRYLRRVQNSDKGIPATKPGEVSGGWTSGETLETLLSTPYHDIDPRPFAITLIDFLKNTQFTDGDRCGGWPLVVGSQRASAMATGHAVAALLLAQQYFRDDTTMVTQLRPLSEIGFDWLTRNNNSDGGWGVEPSGGQDGRVSRMISTTYALRAYFADAKTVDNSRTVYDAIQWIRKLANRDGGFGGKFGAQSDPCSTARAVVALLRSGFCTPNNRLIKRAIRYITRSRPQRQLWTLDTETYVTEGAPGQTIYNSNTTTDVLEAYLRACVFNKHVKDLLTWFVRNQEEEGSWFLGANDNFVRDVATWSTNEALFVLGLATQVYDEQKFSHLLREVQAFHRIAIAVALIAALELLFIVHLPTIVTDVWNLLPEAMQTFIIGTVIAGLIINLVSSLLYERFGWHKQSSSNEP